MSQNNRVNGQIRVPRVQLVLHDGTMRGEMPTREAIDLAQQYGMDLVEVSPSNNGTPPVCKILDYGKLRYEQKKKAKHNRHESQVKEIRIGYTTSDHDLEIKHKTIREFLAKNHKVKYTLRLKGRQNRMRDEALRKFNESIENLSDVAKWSNPSQSGGTISTTLIPRS